MTLEEAIKEYEKELSEWSPIAHPIWRDTVKIGLEALNREQLYRQRVPLRDIVLLPGETKERTQ